MAKTRKTTGKRAGGARKGSSAKKSRTAKKKPARRATKLAAGKRRDIELRPMREKLNADLAILRSAEQTPKIQDSIVRLEACLAEVEAICGPDMTIPLP